MYQLTTQMPTLIMRHNRFSENNKQGCGGTYTTPSGFQDQKPMTSRFQGRKTATLTIGQ